MLKSPCFEGNLLLKYSKQNVLTSERDVSIISIWQYIHIWKIMYKLTSLREGDYLCKDMWTKYFTTMTLSLTYVHTYVVIATNSRKTVCHSNYWWWILSQPCSEIFLQLVSVLLQICMNFIKCACFHRDFSESVFPGRISRLASSSRFKIPSPRSSHTCPAWGWIDGRSDGPN